MTQADPSNYRPCVGIVLINKTGQIFIGERSDVPGAWQMPQGGIDQGEDIKQAALRELKEETGTDKAEIIKITADWYYYDYPSDMAQKPNKGKWLGQRQHWVLARFTGTEADINLAADDHPEFGQWRWASAEEVIAAIIPFKRDVYRSVLAELL